MLFFLVIVAVPFIIVLVSLVRPELVEQVIREPSGRGVVRPQGTVEQPGPTRPR
ncbi:hypothetical protein [Acidisoma sp.]|uniref:hypothetical protein n=1 Tax=Acidisoma sp. TaxID=1872115 RepID=UPI003B009C07